MLKGTVYITRLQMPKKNSNAITTTSIETTEVWLPLVREIITNPNTAGARIRLKTSVQEPICVQETLAIGL